MHTVFEDTVERYHTGLVLQTVHALGVLIYRWYLHFTIKLCPLCQMELPRFLLLDQILCFYCALRFLPGPPRDVHEVRNAFRGVRRGCTACTTRLA
jgi:hypothetical protein